ncbi:hypothetical protein L2Y94_06560 [Luteibacter aegosomatis]|uniref:hypothetical protein n=1 Tax=Luteibacter aegosomatis TaxID=2911537 RepID=UPI001FF8BB55|nr:hypothetical protein [Luteibacter aegosomatis]UPG87013.1 hypothetical protein L2Y94_06560 [Luteibacter aegosomatis]
MPTELTDAIAEPVPPPQHCRTATGDPGWCLIDALSWIEDWRGTLMRCNADRATTARIGNAVQKAVKP